MDDYKELEEETRDRRKAWRSTRSSSRKFSKRLDSDRLYVKSNDRSVRANYIRVMAEFASSCIRPRILILVLFIVAVYTTLCLALNLFSNIFFIYCFKDLSVENNINLGDIHDVKIRLFGVFFALFAMMIEVDWKVVEKSFQFFKSYIPRSILLLLVATLSEPNAIGVYQMRLSKLTDDFAYSSYNFIDDANEAADGADDNDSTKDITGGLALTMIRLQSNLSLLL